MTKEELVLEAVKCLKKEYPEAGCTLGYNQAWKLLVSVQLAAQCMNARANVVVQDLYAKYPNVESLAEADIDGVEWIVKPCGLGHDRVKDISGCVKMSRGGFGREVSDDFNTLMKLPGVGRKSANPIMGNVFGESAIVTDTHYIQLVSRIGLVDSVKGPKKVEMALWELIPPEEGSDFHHQLVFHGGGICTV